MVNVEKSSETIKPTKSTSTHMKQNMRNRIPLASADKPALSTSALASLTHYKNKNKGGT